MAYNALNNLIDAYIYPNGVQAITGSILNNVLKAMVSQLGGGYNLMGMAVPASSPAVNDEPKAYFAATAGTYMNFDGIVLAAGEVAVLLTSGNGSWSKQTIYNVPTGTADLENTANFITNAVTDLVNYYTKTEIDTTLANYPTLEALSTALADYYTKTQIDAQKALTDAALADRYTKTETDTKLADYYKKTETYDKDEVDSIIATLSRQEYIVAWDGLAAPDVSAIPAGVTVTYSGTTYTGTLAASASTVNKIYMVWNGTAYDMYGTSADGGYSWVPMGTTSVDLSQYATKAEVSQLEAEVTEFYGDYIENPEFIRVYTDEEGRILWAIKVDGTVMAAAGFEAAGYLSFDGEDVTFVEHPEFAYVRTDAGGHILYGVQKDGNFLFGCGVPSQIVNYINNRISDLSLDEYEKMVAFLGDLIDGDKTLAQLIYEKVDRVQGKSLIDSEYAATKSTIESPEFIDVETDNDGRLLSSRSVEGTKKEYVGFESPNVTVGGTKTEGIDDLEGRTEVKTDAEGRIISYRDSDGIAHEAVGIEAKSASFGHLNISDEGMTEFQQALKDSGFQPGGAGDWSDYVSDDGANPLCISEPRCAMLNILSDIDLTTLSKKGRAGASKGINYDVPVEVEFYDMQGNYFKKWAEIGGQGNSSMTFVKKNIAVDLFDDETRDGAFAVKFGNWVSQDSYHLKSFYTDFFKGVSVVAYKIAMQAQKTRGVFDDISWKKALIDKNAVTDNPWDYPVTDLRNETNYEARCMPDGFPVIVYQQGQFYGVFALCLKKHRDNYHMDKGKDTHVHLDGIITDTTLFDANGNIDWTQFEVRNPKNLYYKEEHGGTYSYDADLPGQYEIADQTTVNAWIAAGQFPNGTVITSKIEKQLKTTAKVHKYVEDLSYRYRSVVAESSTEAKMAAFEQYFDPDNLIDYLLINMALGDGDGFGPNWQWTTWDGVKWFVNQYDKDNTFGSDSKGFFINGVRNPMTWYGAGSYIMAFLRTYYMDRIKARWTELVNAGVFTKENFLKVTNDWVARIGYNNLYKEYKEKWTESPCCRDPKVSANWRVQNIQYSTIDETNYDPETVYMNGDTCKVYQLGFNIIFECTVDNTQGVFPCYQYNFAPMYLGFYDNIWRVAKYIDGNLSAVNSFINNL